MVPATLMFHHLLIPAATGALFQWFELAPFHTHVSAHRREKIGQALLGDGPEATLLFCSHLIGLNLITYPHLATGESGERSLELDRHALS